MRIKVKSFYIPFLYFHFVYIIAKCDTFLPTGYPTFLDTFIKRENNSKFSPLRFHIHYGTVEINSLDKLRNILNKATAKISNLLQVKPVVGPLLLQRLSCNNKWLHGENKGLCSSIRFKQKGEFCINKIDRFLIPTNHLQKLDVYNYTGSTSLYSLPQGTGVANSDYILYVNCHFSKWCQGKSIQAYASYCRLNHDNRPVAGFINFCPHILNNDLLNEDYYVNVAIHELFHALGFSKDLFQFYKGCPVDSEICDQHKSFVLEDDYRIPRLVLPSVVEQMKKHFNCSDMNFGAPLERKADESYSSHWDPVLLYGSIMMPSLEKLKVAVIDPITVAVFADMGWYKVNFSMVDSYYWGKDGGCRFGLEDTCHNENIIETHDKSYKACNYSQIIKECLAVYNQSVPYAGFSEYYENELFKRKDGLISYFFKCFNITKPKITSCINLQLVSLEEVEEWACRSELVLSEYTLFCPAKGIICANNNKEHMKSVNGSMQFLSTYVIYFIYCFITYGNIFYAELIKI